MKQRIILPIVFALALPTAIYGASVDVVKEEAPIAVGERISVTASPEANRLVRQESAAASKDVKRIVAPAAQAFTDRLQVAVTPEMMKENHLDFTYPTVQSVSPYVTKAINKTLVNYVEKLRKDLHKSNEKAPVGEKENLYLTYDVKADGNGIFSVTLKSYRVLDNAANGSSTEKGFTFNTTTGRQLSLSDFGGIQKSQIEEAFNVLKESSKKRIYDDMTITKGDSFFARENHDIVLIYNQGTIAPMSSGTIYLEVGNLGR